MNAWSILQSTIIEAQTAFPSRQIDLRSHERGYPALLDITRGGPVGALVFAKGAVAGDIWLSTRDRVSLAGATVIGRRRLLLAAEPPSSASQADPRYDRQVRLFGDHGQHILAQAKVAIVGLGGVGSVLAEILGRLGVGHFVLVDPDRADSTNLPRLVGATPRDAAYGLADPGRPRWIRSFGRLLARRKVDLARRNIRRARHSTRVERIGRDFVEPGVAERLKDCDYIFLAADSMRARLLFNAIVHQYLIPGVQLGAKVVSDKKTGIVRDVFAVSRLVTPTAGCLLCNGLINSAKLREEATSEQERRQQAYVAEAEVIAPSVMTLNALAGAQAANEFMFYLTGMASEDGSHSYVRFRPATGRVWYDEPCAIPSCPECGHTPNSRLAKGDTDRLPTKIPS